MKKILSFTLSVLMLISGFTFQVVSAEDYEDDIRVTINGQNLIMDQPPVTIDDRTLVPMRDIFEGLGSSVEWNDDTHTAVSVLGKDKVEIQIDNKTAKKNDEDVTLDVPAKLINDTTLMPVRFVSESLGANVDWDDDTRTVSITTPGAEGKAIFTLNFDNLTSFQNNTDFITGAAYDGKNVSLSKDVDHTTGTGQSLKMANRTKADHRVKFKNAFKNAEVGKSYIVSAYVYAPKEAANVGLGAYSDTGTANAYSPVVSKEVSLQANTWTKIAFDYVYEDENISQVGIDQRPASSTAAPTLYIDDVKVCEGSLASDASDQTDSRFTVEEVVNGHRPVPTDFETGKSYDDLIYFGYGSGKTTDEIIAALPEGQTMVDDELLFKKAAEKPKTDYGTIETVDVTGQPFTKALRATVTELPPFPYNFQIDMGSPLEGKGTDGDICLLKVYMRTISGGNDESQNGKIQVVIEANDKINTKKVTGDVTNGSTWNVAYFPFTYETNYTRATIRLGYYLQTVEIGGYEIINYGKNVTLDDMPTSMGSIPTLEKDAEWRKEAWDRIQKIRKGDINVIVKDSEGNPVSNAKVDVNMYEHEFNFGAAVNPGVSTDVKQASVVQKNFNSIVPENNTKWVTYENDPAKTKEMLKKLSELGIKNMRGHVLVWDRDYINNEFVENTAIPKQLWELEKSGTKIEIQAYIKNHINQITSDLSEYITEWDTLNEACNNRYLQNKYGDTIVKEWFDMAREALGNDIPLYYNDFKTNDELFTQLDKMVKSNVEFDGIGLQSHYSSVVDLEDVIALYDKLDEKYGKRLKITEYDFATNDPILQANYTRDLMIASFAQESFDGFIMWGYKGGTGERFVMYDDNWNEKPGLTIWQDLIYNKWWTDESGSTSQDGSFKTRGFYGDYDITVTTEDGRTKTVSVPCHKNNDNTITITMD